MSAEIMGVSLSNLEAPIRTALNAYGELSGGNLGFDADNACRLELTPDKPNSARSETEATYQGSLIGKLFVIAFKPGDGTGSEVNYKLKYLIVDSPYPRSTRVIPRNKTGVHSEAHITIASQTVDDVHAEPELYAGRYDLLGLDGTIRKIGELGHSETEDVGPITTLTVGYADMKRFGDPHAVFSTLPFTVQLCAFLAITEEVHKKYGEILESLNPQLPIK